MLLALAGIILDCSDPRELSDFYIRATGGEVLRSSPDGDFIRFGGTLLMFRGIAGYQRPSWPSPALPMQMHMDFYVEDVDAAEKQLQELGATTAACQPHRPDGLVVMLDPAGHPFCIATRDGVPAEWQV